MRWRGWCSSTRIPRGHGHSVDHSTGVEVALQRVGVDQATGFEDGHAARPFTTGTGVTILGIFVNLILILFLSRIWHNIVLNRLGATLPFQSHTHFPD